MKMVKVFIKGLEDKDLSSFLRYYPARIKISLSSNTFEKKKKKGLNSQLDSAQIVIFVFTTKSQITWAKVVCFSDSCRKTRRYNKGAYPYNNYRNPLNVRGWATVIVWISPFIVSTCLPAAVRKNVYLCPCYPRFCGENKDNNLG